jgi:hypothetical protein
LYNTIQMECCIRVRKVAVKGPSNSYCFLTLILHLGLKELGDAEKRVSGPKQFCLVGLGARWKMREAAAEAPTYQVAPYDVA